MQRLAAALAVLVLAGCGEVKRPLSPFESAEVDPPPTADAAIAIAMQLYADRTGLAMPAVRVRWWEGDRILWGDKMITGITFACDDIWVWSAPSQHITDGPLAHELAHCAFMVAEDIHGDPDHLSDTWWGSGGYHMQARRALLEAGL